MPEIPHDHPSYEQLQAFAEGCLPAVEQQTVESHVATCRTCCEFLRQAPHGDLVRQLRTAEAEADPVPEQPGVIAMPLDSPTRTRRPAADIPPGLLDHPRYHVTRRLGAGGMGVVFEAQHRVMDRPVALKVISAKLLQNQKAIDRFQQEVQAAAKLSHRNIVTAYDAEQAEDLHFLVMEFVEGADLASLVAERGPLPVQHACHYCMQVAMGLQHAHDEGMVHRDIKPQNLIRTPRGVVKILDFGLARLARTADSDSSASGLTAEGVTLGTPDYIAPEQARDARSADIRADIYSLGCTLYFLLTGRPPFSGSTAMEKVLAHFERRAPAIRDVRSDVPEPVIACVEHMMEKDPANRFQTPRDVVEALRPFASAATKAPTLSGAGGVTGAGVVDIAAFHPAAGAGSPSVERPDRYLESRFAVVREPAPGRRVDRRPRARNPWPSSRFHVTVAGFAVLSVILGLIVFVPGRGEGPGQPPGPGDNGRTVTTFPNDGSAVADSATGRRDDAAEAAGERPADTESEWIDLIATADPRTSPASGNWQREHGELSVEGAEWARILLATTAPDEFDLQVEFTRTSGSQSVAIFFPVGAGQAGFELDAWNDHLAGFQLVDQLLLTSPQNPTRARNPIVPNGVRQNIRFQVRRNGVQVELNGAELCRYQGNGSDLTMLPEWAAGGPAAGGLVVGIGVGAFRSATTFHRIRLRPVTN